MSEPSQELSSPEPECECKVATLETWTAINSKEIRIPVGGIIYCPLHQAAEKLLEAAKGIIQAFAAFQEDPDGSTDLLLATHALNKAAHAITEAEQRVKP